MFAYSIGHVSEIVFRSFCCRLSNTKDCLNEIQGRTQIGSNVCSFVSIFVLMRMRLFVTICRRVLTDHIINARTGGANGANDSHADMLLSYPIIHLSNLIITTLSYQFLSDKLCKLSQAETAQSYPIELIRFSLPSLQGSPNHYN